LSILPLINVKNVIYTTQVSLTTFRPIDVNME